MNLAKLKPGQKGVIKEINIKGPLKRRLMDMGILVGEEISVKKVAPFGDPIEVTVKQYQLSFRKNEAEAITIDILAS